MFRSLFSSRPDISHLKLTLLSKEECHLCDEALETIERLRRTHPFQLELIKIEPGDNWYEGYWDKIPVGLLDGEMIFKYRVAPDELLAKLHARAGNSR